MKLALGVGLVIAFLLGACGGDGRSPSGSANQDVPAPPVSALTVARTGTPSIPAAGKRLGTLGGVETTIRNPEFEALRGAKAEFGILGKAAFRIEVPDSWNGELVLYAHGVRLFGNEVYVSNPLGPLREQFVRGGFAWAASSYSENFYVPGVGADDSMELLREFVKRHGLPKRVYIAGESMGGNVVALLLEKGANPNASSHAFAMPGRRWR